MIKELEGERGLHRNIIYDCAKPSMSMTEINVALNYLSAEGHIYSTNDFFKTSDSIED